MPRAQPTPAHPSRVIATVVAMLLLALLPAAAQASSGGIGPGGSSGGGGNGGGGKAEGNIEGLSPTYTKFVKLVSGRTDLSLRVVGAWTLAEGGPKDNPLNIGPGRRYGTVRRGAKATTRLLSGSSLYRRVIASAGDPDPLQIRAIAKSPWCPGCRGYERLLKRTYRSVEVKP